MLGPGQSTPAPWINVVSNASFGFQVAAEGGGYTWSQNSRDNQLTPWSNDPVSDRPGEILYVRDVDTGRRLDSDGAADPPRAGALHRASRAGLQPFRASRPTASCSSCCSTWRSTIRSRSRGSPCATSPAGSRRLSVTAYVEWVLGLARGASAPTIVTERDAATGAIFARNPWNIDHGSRVAFADLAGQQTGWTGDRGEFIGRNGTTGNPAALSDTHSLSQRVGAGLDPCAALQTHDRARAATASTEIVFFLGQASDAAQARDPDRTLPRHRSRRRASRGHDILERHARHDPGEDAGPGPGHPAQRLAALPDARLPRTGRARPSTSRAAPTASATSCRTSWR